MNIELVVMEIITNAGESKSEAMMALQHAKRHEWQACDAALMRSKEAAGRAHAIQTQLIGLDEGEGKVPVTLVMVHAQDHLMTAMLANELIKEMIEMYRNKS
ncbi:PTS lactose/cellobiose transporter subunit IIA [Pantoea allii]|uniref:PTS system glucosamine dimer-specific IIA component (Lac family) n=1 Tax=Pantoea allii TaxID=574096 RepID=A0A2V2BIX2_9GAMM|nr:MULTISPECIES: PTS lactose/cellobiose transporter subunit IIA [Pantoea]MBW1252090.1 PTS lactose/cellobiose transporter subunit IIA [Pantoea allii]MBW1261370.1 PTS lactose/cellobiose transporter subunit IIA [Pantoea allii]MBW1283971.1 PTS lactose/cellobiose transporter subunit IIA [Pantoea allii]MCH9299537.1 PTS lactose/cellobiose transporter subunit IIA [Pantoea allii]MDJ0039914.1 PTS lactose/cellobiose transporter subunit IIA [Pantoea allii]